MKLTVIDLCSGIGGFSYGLERTGYFETIQFVEIDSFCQKVLKKNFPNIPIHEDINTYKPVNADVVTAGFPCQPFSVAGLRKGINDDRNLWSETFRIITEAKPKWFIGENVEGIINISNGAVLQQIQKDLEKENFQVQCLVVPASGVGAWHQRKRVWIIANSNSRKRNECIHASKVCETKQERMDSDQERNRNTIRSKVERCSDEQTISNTNSKRLQGHELQSDNLQEKDKSTINSNSSFERQQTWWQTQSELCGVPNGISYELDKNRANRIKAVGNSICPEVIYEIGKAIKKAEVDIHQPKRNRQSNKGSRRPSQNI